MDIQYPGNTPRESPKVQPNGKETRGVKRVKQAIQGIMVYHSRCRTIMLVHPRYHAGSSKVPCWAIQGAMVGYSGYHDGPFRAPKGIHQNMVKFGITRQAVPQSGCHLAWIDSVFDQGEVVQCYGLYVTKEAIQFIPPSSWLHPDLILTAP